MTQDENPVVEEISEEPRPKGHRFTKGHPKFGGARKKTASKMWNARETAERLAFNPVEEAITLYRTGKLPTTPGVKAQDAPPGARVKALETVLSFLLPRLSHQSLSGPDGGKIQTESVDITFLMQNPATARAAQTVALAMSTAQREGRLGITDGTVIDAEATEDPQ